MTTKKPKSAEFDTDITAVDLGIDDPEKKQRAKKTVMALTADATGQETSEDAAEKRKSGKAKAIKDSFSFPEQDYKLLKQLKKTFLEENIPVKKSELLCAGLHLLAKLKLPELKAAVMQVGKVKTGGPKSKK